MYKFNNAQKIQVATFHPHPVFKGIEALHTRFKTVVENNRAVKAYLRHIDEAPKHGHIAMVIRCHLYALNSGLPINEMTANLCVSGKKSPTVELSKYFADDKLKIDKIKGRVEIKDVNKFWAPQIDSWNISDGDIIVLVYTKHGKTHSAEILYGESSVKYRIAEKTLYNDATNNKDKQTTERTHQNER